MRGAALVLVAILIACGTPASAEEPGAPRAESWSVSGLMDRAGIDRAWLKRAVEVMPPSVREIDAQKLSSRLVEYLPTQIENVPGFDHNKYEEEMRVMVIAMGAMSGYMIAAMPLSVSGVLWAVTGGYAANYWYENYR